MPEPHPRRRTRPGRPGRPASRRGRDAQPRRRPATPATGSPVGSAAATSSSSRVALGQIARCRRSEACPPIRPGSGSASGSPKPPASSAGDSRRGSSSRASGFPRVSATIRSRTRSSSGHRTTEASSSRASASRSPRSPAPAARPGPGPAPGREHHQHRLGPQPPRHERQRLCRGLVQPLRVIDHAHQRALGRPPRTAGSAPPGRPGTDPVPGLAQAERRLERVALRLGQAPAAGPGTARTAGAARRTRSSISGLAPRAARTTRRSAAACAGVVQQRRLAHPRLAAQHQRPRCARRAPSASSPPSAAHSSRRPHTTSIAWVGVSSSAVASRSPGAPRSGPSVRRCVPAIMTTTPSDSSRPRPILGSPREPARSGLASQWSVPQSGAQAFPHTASG